jgi:multiple sugar transport system ATP-binding protein
VLTGLALIGVTKRFGNTLVLDDVTIDVGAEEFLVVLGPSGCGKSTLLRAIAGLESIDSGRIEIHGDRVDHLAPGQRGVAMVFQGYALYPHMTVRGNIDFALRNAGMPQVEIERRVTDVARTLELTAFLDRRPAQLSGGQRQRVAIGRALVKEPRVFMFDEPLSNLDAALRGRMRQEIANLHRRVRTTMVFVTHDQTEAMTLADRIVVMNQRRIEQIGTPMEIYRNPATIFVAEFIGSPPMNLLPVTYSAGGAGVVLPNGVPLPGVVPAGVDAAAEHGLRLGVRPEAIEVLSPAMGHAEGAVEFVEYLGDRCHVLITLLSGEQITVAAAPTCDLHIGQAASIRFDLQQAHLFDSAGRNCRPRARV